MLSQIHLLLAYLSAATTALVAVEAGWRAFRNVPSTAVAGRLSAAQLISLLVTSIVGLGLVTIGEQARDSVHFLLAVIALALVPGASTVAHAARPRIRAAVTSLTALFALGAVALLFMTG